MGIGDGRRGGGVDCWVVLSINHYWFNSITGEARTVHVIRLIRFFPACVFKGAGNVGGSFLNCFFFLSINFFNINILKRFRNIKKNYLK